MQSSNSQAVVKQPQQQKYTGGNGAKKIPFFSSAPKDYAGYTIYRVGFFVDWIKEVAQSQDKTKTTQCCATEILDCPWTVTGQSFLFLHRLSFCKEFLKLTSTPKDASCRVSPTQAGSSHGSETGNKLGSVRPTSTLR